MCFMKKILKFYADGFASMRLGKTLWAIIIIKLLVIFVVLKILFFDHTLESEFPTPAQKTDFVLQNLTKKE